ncbi:NAD-dependent epimerase/dehydratase family protein [Patescibacteria group bacterium]
MKIIVTGGAGFIGSHIVDALIKKGHKVVVLDDLSTGKKEYVNKKAKFYKISVTGNINKLFLKEKPNLVIHAAGQVMLRKSIEDPADDAKRNIIGTINVLEGCRVSGVKKIIYLSTGGARVGEPEYLPVDELHPLNPCSPYGISKHTAEHYIHMYSLVYGLKYLIFGFGNVYGPRDDWRTNRVTTLFAYLMLQGKTPTIYGDGDQTRDFIYVQDLVDFVVRSINKNPKHKLFHIANGKQVSVNQIYSELQKLTNFTGLPQHKKAIKGEVRDIKLDTRLARRELGWKPKYTLKQGLAETVEWFKSQT